ncbi:tRNA lysidine(34) synthetase TilS [Pseudomonas sp. R5(2019)]|uniref:tRNA lysidine(34) synthetase TilS n=1 Tax=Pseudomonas sp. R5(2019) TaxID=2697566 RepID=UPI0014133EA5|nr:tRNA lysidine(34) synthetase TilS [Pseudomonas sp. R5(2019)]NBA95371.1 tRNA lysidine(34) synthetase TilS [Pseudomonas sp. R5(2019)]
MPAFPPSLQSRLLTHLAPWRNAPAWYIALSGGLDSTVLLHLIAQLTHSEKLPPLRALHVHHGLQAAASGWPARCKSLCDSLNVPLQVIHVQVEAGASLEQQARDARYAAFAQVLGQDEVLLLAQHRDDQAETLLFRLLRGSGLRGLAAMPRQRRLAAGHLLRPLLDVPRGELLGYAQAHGLSWIDDPSNTDSRFSRNFLRNEVMPVLARRWPQAGASMARAAEHLAEAQGLLDELAEQDLSVAATPSGFEWLGLSSLALAPLLALSSKRQRNALQCWLAPRTRLPDSRHWASWESLRDAGASATALWQLTDGQLHRAGGRLWWLSGDWLLVPEGTIGWQATAQPLSLPGNGKVWLSGDLPQGRLRVGYRQGGEVLALSGRGHRDLKRLLNEWGLPAFARARLPLLYLDEQLVAVANRPGAGAGNLQLHWLPPTNAQGLR